MFSNDPTFTVSIALAAGVLGQTLAHHLRIPGIVLLLVLGVVLGPDGLDIVRPRSIGTGLPLLVELAVAIILFEGGLGLNIQRIRREASTIRALITTGALVTAAGAALTVHWVIGWDWSVSILFGTLVIVTGPTVITPLLRRIQVKRNLHTILEAEGVLIDPVGAVIAVVALEVIVTGGHNAASSPLDVLAILAIGVLVGAIGGLVISLFLRGERLVPEALKNILTLSLALAVFEISNAIRPESGIMAVVAAGMVVGNLTTGNRELLLFKEQLTVLMVGMLFVLLAADVRIEDVQAVGWGGLATIAILMFVVRPLDVAASTIPSGLSLREKAFLSWLSPRGIVAAAVASLFAQTMTEAGMPGGAELRALVFMVIATTVVVQGLTGGWVATALGVRRTQNNGYVIMGAGALGRALAVALTEGGHEVVLVDRNPGETRVAQREGLSAIPGDATEEATLLAADIECRRGIITATPNAAVNLLVAQQARDMAGSLETYVALDQGRPGIAEDRVLQDGHHILFGHAFDMERWNHDLLRGLAGLQHWELAEDATDEVEPRVWRSEAARAVALPMLFEGKKRAEPVDERTRPRPGDQMVLATMPSRRTDTDDALGRAGWRRSEDEPASDGSP